MWNIKRGWTLLLSKVRTWEPKAASLVPTCRSSAVHQCTRIKIMAKDGQEERNIIQGSEQGALRGGRCQKERRRKIMCAIERVFPKNLCQQLRSWNNISPLAYFPLRIFRATWNCPSGKTDELRLQINNKYKTTCCNYILHWLLKNWTGINYFTLSLFCIAIFHNNVWVLVFQKIDTAEIELDPTIS